MCELTAACGFWSMTIMSSRTRAGYYTFMEPLYAKPAKNVVFAGVWIVTSF